MGTSGGGADRCRIQGFHFPHCVVNGVLRLPCGIYEDHSNTEAEIILTEAYEIKRFIILKGLRERDIIFLENHAKLPKSPKFGLDRQESRPRTHWQVPLLSVIGGGACGVWEAFSLGNGCNWVNMQRRKEVKW